MARLKLLWITLKQQSTTHQSLIDIKNEVTDQFKQLHDLLIIEEHKINSILNDRVQQTSSTIHDIINEIKSINEIFKPSSGVSDKVDGVNDDNNITQTIRSCQSLDQFIEQAFPTTSSGINQDVSITITDNELLTLIQRNVQMSTTSKYQLTRSIRLDIDTDTLDDIKKQIPSCFQLLEDTDKFTADLDHHVMVYKTDEYSLFSPMTNTWTVIKEGGIYNGAYHSAVYAHGYIYMFGGQKDDLTKYCRFSIATREWQRNIPIVGVSGGTFIHTCYDGDRHIYLIGGEDDECIGALTRLASFNIDTQQFTHVGDFNLSLYPDTTIIYSNVIYAFIDSEDKERIHIQSFNVITKQQDEYALMPGRNGSDVFNDILCRCTSEPGTLMLLNGKDMNYQYSIKLDEWSKINDNDQFKHRGTGTCELFDRPRVIHRQ
ncbi:hypothetical protein SAMD00019534_050360 [Acytostelium subglobosum LB1]|uniref:hypothetical protein n=1 Tax=Acytostelium subglobosum LB1 TaxID=1410327 RepID=UPI000644AB79|nr:hypothetical protein SAMD00019534_050360 [Acytostelium subglobosum LB1]GAM21861.1 hypothetical protein SAMD00019534_050360 [Acytostelium subglobosum LB1]|eukprot:XP_012754961.1 hypothetical protein SAMD00019534_050360 [Acytostelium subglobosum LB1]